MSGTDQADSRAIQRAESLLDLGRPREAVPLLQQALASNPDSARAWSVLALAHLQAEQGVAAADAARHAIAAGPDEEWGHRLLALAELRLGGTAAALGEAREAVRLAPEIAETHVVLARVLSAIKPKDAAAMVAAVRAVQLSPHSADTHAVVGAVSLAAGDLPGARRALMQALALDPQHVAARNDLARVDLAGARWGGARGLATAAHGFADVARMAPGDDVGRTNVDVVLHAVLARSAYVVFLAAWLAKGLDGVASVAVRMLPALVVLVPVGYLVRFVNSLSSGLRAYFWSSLRRPRLFGSSVLMVAAIGCLVALPFAPAAVRPVCAGIGLGCAVVSRLVLAWAQPMPDGRYSIGTWLIWVIFILLAFITLMLLLGLLSDPAPFSVDGGIALVVLVGLTAWPAWVLRRRHVRRRDGRGERGDRQRVNS